MKNKGKPVIVNGMLLVTKQGEPVLYGKCYPDFRGDCNDIVTGGCPPTEPGKTGYVYVNDHDSTGPDSRYYPSVYGFKWVPNV